MAFLQLPGLGKVHLHEYGNGPRPMLAFHGYGMTGRQFHVLKQSVLTKYHVYGVDHFFHGESNLNGWTEPQILAGMPRNFARLYLEEWFRVYGRQRISIMAYSIGADIALLLAEEYAEWIDELILMAPDGIAPYKGFQFLQHHAFGKSMFRRFTKSKWLAPASLKALKRIKIIDQDLYTIAYNEIDTPKKRSDVYYTLNLIRRLVPDKDKLTEVLNNHPIRCIFIYGKHDLLFPLADARPFIERLKNAEVHEVPMGHWLVTTQLDDYLLNCNL